MSHWIGLFMVWLGGALCGTVYTSIWFARQVRSNGYYTRADVDAAYERVRHFDFSDASDDTHPKDGDVKQAPLVSGAVGEAETPGKGRP